MKHSRYLQSVFPAHVRIAEICTVSSAHALISQTAHFSSFLLPKEFQRHVFNLFRSSHPPRRGASLYSARIRFVRFTDANSSPGTHRRLNSLSSLMRSSIAIKMREVKSALSQTTACNLVDLVRLDLPCPRVSRPFPHAFARRVGKIASRAANLNNAIH